MEAKTLQIKNNTELSSAYKKIKSRSTDTLRKLLYFTKDNEFPRDKKYATSMPLSLWGMCNFS